MDETKDAGDELSGEQRKAARQENLGCVLLAILFLLCVLTPPVAFSLIAKFPIVGPIVNILLSAGYIFLWSRFGPSPINGMLNGLTSVIVLFYSLVSIVLSITMLLGQLAG